MASFEELQQRARNKGLALSKYPSVQPGGKWDYRLDFPNTPEAAGLSVYLVTLSDVEAEIASTPTNKWNLKHAVGKEKKKPTSKSHEAAKKMLLNHPGRGEQSAIKTKRLGDGVYYRIFKGDDGKFSANVEEGGKEMDALGGFISESQANAWAEDVGYDIVDMVERRKRR